MKRRARPCFPACAVDFGNLFDGKRKAASPIDTIACCIRYRRNKEIPEIVRKLSQVFICEV